MMLARSRDRCFRLGIGPCVAAICSSRKDGLDCRTMDLILPPIACKYIHPAMRSSAPCIDIASRSSQLPRGCRMPCSGNGCQTAGAHTLATGLAKKPLPPSIRFERANVQRYSEPHYFFTSTSGYYGGRPQDLNCFTLACGHTMPAVCHFQLTCCSVGSPLFDYKTQHTVVSVFLPVSPCPPCSSSLLSRQSLPRLYTSLHRRTDVRTGPQTDIQTEARQPPLPPGSPPTSPTCLSLATWHCASTFAALQGCRGCLAR